MRQNSSQTRSLLRSKLISFILSTMNQTFHQLSKMETIKFCAAIHAGEQKMMTLRKTVWIQPLFLTTTKTPSWTSPSSFGSRLSAMKTWRCRTRRSSKHLTSRIPIIDQSFKSKTTLRTPTWTGTWPLTRKGLNPWTTSHSPEAHSKSTPCLTIPTNGARQRTY